MGYKIKKPQTAEGHLEAFHSYYKGNKHQPPPGIGLYFWSRLTDPHHQGGQQLKRHSGWISAIKGRDNHDWRGRTT